MSRTIEYAHKSACGQRHAALVYKSGRVLSIAINKYRNNPSIFPSDLLTREKELMSVHAEVAAMMGISKKNLQGATLYIARVTNRGARLSKPCSGCQKALDKAGVRKVVYTYG